MCGNILLFIIAKTWKQPKCQSTDEWIRKMWYKYTVEYYLAIKRSEIIPFATTQMNLGISYGIICLLKILLNSSGK